MAALPTLLFRTWSPISDAQRMSVRAFDDQVKETPYICKRRVSRRIASVYHADKFSELHSNVICATKFYSEMLPIKSTCSYVLSERCLLYTSDAADE